MGLIQQTLFSNAFKIDIYCTLFFNINTMKKQAAFTVIFILLSHFLLAQTKTDTIDIQKNWLGTFFRMPKGEKTTFRNLTKFMGQDPQVSPILKKTKCRAVIGESMLIVAVSGSIISLVSLSSPHPNTFSQDIAFTSLGLFAGGFSFVFSAKHIFKKAVRIYNSDVQKTGYNKAKSEFYFSFTGNTVVLGIRF